MDHSDIFSEEARKTLIRFKVYKLRENLTRNPDELVKNIKVSSRIASEKQFEVAKTLNQKPERIALDEVIATQTDLYVTMTLNENIQQQRIKRKKFRMLEEMASKLSKVNGFVDEVL